MISCVMWHVAWYLLWCGTLYTVLWCSVCENVVGVWRVLCGDVALCVVCCVLWCNLLSCGVVSCGVLRYYRDLLQSGLLWSLFSGSVLWPTDYNLSV